MILHIMSRERAEMALRDSHPYTHLISIRDYDTENPIIGFSKVPRHLLLKFDDVCRDPDLMERHGYVPPDDTHVQDIIDFAKTVPAEAEMLVHCEAGISRSTAAAFIVRAIQRGEGQEVEALVDVFDVRPQANPNSLMVQKADWLLKRGGKMTEALDAARRARFEQMYAYATSGVASAVAHHLGITPPRDPRGQT